MDAYLSAEERAFQAEVRDFVIEHLPASIAAKVRAGGGLVKEDYVTWHKILARRGWAGENWPVEHGGTGWTATQKTLFANECALAGAPRLSPFGLKMVAPVIYMFGNDAQKQRFLPPILNADVWWCQGYSEPEAGSDLAALKTRAFRDGDDYVVNGSKTWTTYAHWADWIFCLVRTGDESEKAQSAISFLLIDMKTPGITVSPIRLLDGEQEVNEVHFNEVRVPQENLIGEEGRGWTYAKLLLTHERTGIAQIPYSKERLQRLKALARSQRIDGELAFEHTDFARRLAAVELELNALEYTELRCLASVMTGQAPGPESSILKIKGTEVMQSIDTLYMDLAGQESLIHNPDQFYPDYQGPQLGSWYAASTGNRYFNNRKVSIYGGSNEVQKNIIAKTILGL